MIVAMPQIAVNATPVKTPASPAATPGQFSTVLSQATQNTQDPSAPPKIMSKNGSSSRGNVSTKDNQKSSAKAPASSVTTALVAQPTTANLPNDNSVKLLGNASFSAFLSLQTEPTAGESSDAISNSDLVPAGKSDSAASSTGAPSGMLANAPAVPAVLGGQISAEPFKATPEQKNAPAQGAGADVAPSSLVIPLTVGISVTGPTNVVDAKAPSSAKISVGQNATKNASANLTPDVATTPKPTTADTKPAARETAQNSSTADGKSASSLMQHKGTVADVPQIPVAPLPPIQPLSMKPSPLQNAQTANSATAKTSVDAVPSSSGTLKKDEDSAQNPPSQSQKNEASAAVTGTAIKQAASDGQVQSSGTSASNVGGSAQVSSPVVEVKAAATSLTPKTTDPAPKNLNQTSSSLPDAEATAEAAAAHLASPIQVAKLVERAGETELRVGIQAGEFGSVDIRTSMARSQFTAEISVERGELGRAMAAELPGLHSRLAEQRVPPANIILQNHASGSGSSSDLRQGTRQNQYAPAIPLGSHDTDSNQAMVAMEAMESSAGLDIHI